MYNKGLSEKNVREDANLSVDEKRKPAASKPERSKRGKSRVNNRRVVLGVIAALAVIYVGTSVYFMHHFFPQTTLMVEKSVDIRQKRSRT